MTATWPAWRAAPRASSAMDSDASALAGPGAQGGDVPLLPSCCTQSPGLGFALSRPLSSPTCDVSAPSRREPPGPNTSVLGACVRATLEETAVLSSQRGGSCLPGWSPSAGGTTPCACSWARAGALGVPLLVGQGPAAAPHAATLLFISAPTPASCRGSWCGAGAPGKRGVTCGAPGCRPHHTVLPGSAGD